MNKTPYTQDEIMQILNIGVYEDSELTNEDIDNIIQDRFEIRNYVERDNKNFSNVYVFKVPDTSSKTGFVGMGLSKSYVEKVKSTLAKMQEMKKSDGF